MSLRSKLTSEVLIGAVIGGGAGWVMGETLFSPIALEGNAIAARQHVSEWSATAARFEHELPEACLVALRVAREGKVTLDDAKMNPEIIDTCGSTPVLSKKAATDYYNVQDRLDYLNNLEVKAANQAKPDDYAPLKRAIAIGTVSLVGALFGKIVKNMRTNAK